MEIGEDAIPGDGKAFCDGIDDAEIGLVGNDQFDLIGRNSGTFEDRFGRLFHAGDGMFEDFFPEHREGGEALVRILDGDGAG